MTRQDTGRFIGAVSTTHALVRSKSKKSTAIGVMRFGCVKDAIGFFIVMRDVRHCESYHEGYSPTLIIILEQGLGDGPQTGVQG